MAAKYVSFDPVSMMSVLTKFSAEIEHAHVDVIGAGVVVECDRDIAVGQDRDRRRELVSTGVELADLDLAAVKVAGRDDREARIIDSPGDNGRAGGVIGVAVICPDHDVPAVRQAGDLAFGLDFPSVRSIGLNQSFPNAWGRGHSSFSIDGPFGATPSAR